MLTQAWRTLAIIALIFGCTSPDGNDSTDGGSGGEGGQGGQGGFIGPGGMGGGGPGGSGGGGDRNLRPELRRIGDREAPVGEALKIELEATDPEGASLTYSVRSTLPMGAKFDKGTGTFSWTPTPAQDGTIVLITFEVSDGQLKDQETIQISVIAEGTGGNKPPRFEDLSDQVLEPGRPFEMQVIATDPNGDELTYSIQGEPPMGAAIDSRSGIFQWNPPAEASGQSFSVVFVVSDGMLDASAEVRLVIREGGGNGQNLPPRITAIDDMVLEAGVPFVLVVHAEDDNPASLMFNTAGLIPQGAQFDANTATFTWTPAENQANQAHAVVFQVSDGEFRAIERVSFQVRPGGGPGPNMCMPDAEEANEPLPVVHGTQLNRTMCPKNDEDLHLIDLQIGDTVTVDVTFSHANNDIDAVLLTPAMAAAHQSDSVTDNEHFTYQAVTAGVHQLLIYSTDVGPYGLSISIEEGGGIPPMMCMDDAADNGAGNDDQAHATPLRPLLESPLQICEGDDDWFSIELQAGSGVLLEASFIHAQGDLDLELIGGGESWRAESTNDNEELEVTPVPATGTYYLHVFGYEGSENSYEVVIFEEAAAPCDPDRVEPNNNRGSAEPVRAELYRNLTWCGDDDWYKTNLRAVEELKVYVTYDGSAPQMEAFTAGGGRIDDQSYSVANGDGCDAGRDGCRLLTVRAAELVYFVVNRGQVGQTYDLRIRIDAAPMGDRCDANNQSCGGTDVCDYANRVCATSLCENDGQCPNDYSCYQSWCVESCQAGNCPNPNHICKHLEAQDQCGQAGNVLVGGPCTAFTDCVGTLDCLTGFTTPGGYCSRLCERDADCEGSACVDFGFNEMRCANRCNGANDCRAGYHCEARNNAEGGGTQMICFPGDQ